MSKTKTRKRFPKVSLHRALQLQSKDEIQRIHVLTAKLQPLMARAKPDVRRSDRGLNDLKLWQLPDRRLSPNGFFFKRYVDVNGVLRYESRDSIFNPPVPESLVPRSTNTKQLRRWRRDLEKLLAKLKKKARKS